MAQQVSREWCIKNLQRHSNRASKPHRYSSHCTSVPKMRSLATNLRAWYVLNWVLVPCVIVELKAQFMNWGVGEYAAWDGPGVVCS